VLSLERDGSLDHTRESNSMGHEQSNATGYPKSGGRGVVR
jgi:hypothetical protein